MKSYCDSAVRWWRNVCSRFDCDVEVWWGGVYGASLIANWTRGVGGSVVLAKRWADVLF